MGGDSSGSASRVVIVDADPNQPIVAWAKLPNKPARVFVVDGVTEETVIDVIDAEAADAPFVLVDLGVVARGAACLAGRLGVGVEGLSLRMALG